jgi:hypothetical protein
LTPSAGETAHEIGVHVDLQIREHLRHHNECGRGRQIQRVAVRRCLNGLLGRNAATGAGRVENDDLLLPAAAKFVGDDARDHVGPARGRALGDQPDRCGGIILRLHGHGHERKANS